MCYIKKAFSLMVAILLLTLSLCPAYGAEQLSLKMNLQKGQIYDFWMSADSVIVQTINRADMTIKQLLGISMSCEVTDVSADGVVTVKMAFSGIRIHQEGPTGAMEYDSANPPADAAEPETENPPADISPADSKVTDATETYFTIKMSAKGEFLEVSGLDAAMEALLKKLGLEPEKSALIRKSLNQQFNDKAIQEMMQQGSGTLPQHPISVGDSWTNRMTLSNIYPFTVESTYKFREYRDGAAYLDIAAMITPVGDSAPLDFAGLKMKYGFSGTQEGTMRVQEANSFVCSGMMTQQLTGFIEISGKELKEPLRWPMNIKTVVEYEMKERK